jgi:uncharacterized protein (TIGR04255 family)
MVDVRVVPSDDLDVLKLRAFGDMWPERYPSVELQTQWQSQFTVAPSDGQVAFETNTSTLGYVLLNSDKDKVVQVQTGGISLSKLSPYEGWDRLIAEFRELWEAYLLHAAPASIARVAVRYINRIALPAGQRIELSDYLHFYPNNPSGLGDMTDFVMRTALRHPDQSAMVGIVTVASEASRESESSSAVVDIDVFIENAIMDVHSDALWLTLSDLREYKNDIFFGAITPRVEDQLK